jgi:hypothetical protein
MLAKKTKHLLIVLASLLLGFVAGIVVAVITSPFWGWFESSTGIESLGHSGPSDWVFELMIGVAILTMFAVLEFAFREKTEAAVRNPGKLNRSERPTRPDIHEQTKN